MSYTLISERLACLISHAVLQLAGNHDGTTHDAGALSSLRIMLDHLPAPRHYARRREVRGGTRTRRLRARSRKTSAHLSPCSRQRAHRRRGRCSRSTELEHAEGLEAQARQAVSTRLRAARTHTTVTSAAPTFRETTRPCLVTRRATNPALGPKLAATCRPGQRLGNVNLLREVY